MLVMKQIEKIKEMQNQGLRSCEIAEKLELNRKTVSKYMKQEDFSPEIKVPKENPSKLDRWKEKIKEWLEDDQKTRFKQRHTARRIYQRLIEEYGESFECSYTLVQRFCKKAREHSKQSRKGFLELVWHPGEAQADFGEADVFELGKKVTIKFLCVTFPHSNSGYIQLFGGETAECVLQGLKDIFQRIGGIPHRIVFDNASGVGRRIKQKIQYAEIFLKFKCQFGFEVTFCNPRSGHEKGNVENKVGYLRRNLLVPVPEFSDIEEYNKELLNRCEKDWQRIHYKKQKAINELFEQDRSSLVSLPTKEFNCFRYERIKTDKYGKFCIDKKHWYSTAPELALNEVIVGLGAHWVEVLNLSGQRIVRHRRMYGPTRTDNVDWVSSTSRLFKNPGAWRNSIMRECLSEGLRKGMDAMDKPTLKNTIKIMRDLSYKYDPDTVVLALEELVDRCSTDIFSASAIAARIANHGLNIMPEMGPDLRTYDNDLLNSGGQI